MASSPSSLLAAHWLWEDPVQGPSRGRWGRAGEKGAWKGH